MKKLPRVKLPRIKVNLKKLAVALVALGLVSSIVGGVLAYNRLYMTNERRFWLAIENSMSTTSVLREVQQGGTGNKQIDRTRFTFGQQAVANKISSVSEKSATTESNVTTETLQTPTSQYIRYLNIYTNEKKQDGSSYDFSSVRGVWAKESEATTVDAKAEAKLVFAQPHITLAMFGSLAPADRRATVKELQDSGAYDIDYKSVTNEEIDGETYIVYSVRVMTKKYVGVLQKHLVRMGYGEFPPLDPANYPENARVNAQFLVNKKSGVLSGLMFNGVTEKYTNYGLTQQIALPVNTVSIDELQSQLQSL